MPVACTDDDFEAARDVVGSSTVLDLVPQVALAIAKERERCAIALEQAQKKKAAQIVRNC